MTGEHSRIFRWRRSGNRGPPIGKRDKTWLWACRPSRSGGRCGSWTPDRSSSPRSRRDTPEAPGGWLSSGLVVLKPLRLERSRSLFSAVLTATRRLRPRPKWAKAGCRPTTPLRVPTTASSRSPERPALGCLAHWNRWNRRALISRMRPSQPSPLLRSLEQIKATEMRSKNVLKQFKVFSTTNDFKFFSGDSTQHVRLKLDVRLALTGWWSPSQNISF